MYISLEIYPQTLLVNPDILKSAAILSFVISSSNHYLAAQMYVSLSVCTILLLEMINIHVVTDETAHRYVKKKQGKNKISFYIHNYRPRIKLKRTNTRDQNQPLSHTSTLVKVVPEAVEAKVKCLKYIQYFCFLVLDSIFFVSDYY